MSINPSHNYKKYQIETSNPEELVILLYEEMVRLLKKVLNGFALLNEIAAKSSTDTTEFSSSIETVNKIKLNIHEDLIKVQNIINELILGLNFESNPEFTKKLESLYIYMYKKLVLGNIKKDETAIKEVKGYIKNLLDSYKESIKKKQIKFQENQELKDINFDIRT